MVFLQGILPYVQIALSVLLIGSILLQRTGASLGWKTQVRALP